MTVNRHRTGLAIVEAYRSRSSRETQRGVSLPNSCYIQPDLPSRSTLSNRITPPICSKHITACTDDSPACSTPCGNTCGRRDRQRMSQPCTCTQG